MQDWLAALEAWPLAQQLRMSRWEYAAVNGTHILAIALLVGAILPLNLRAFGLWPLVPASHLSRVLVPVAATGLAVAMLTGFLMFATRATEYAPLAVFQSKMLLVTIGTASALWGQFRRDDNDLETDRTRDVMHAGISTACWIGALALGRTIAFVTE